MDAVVYIGHGSRMIEGTRHFMEFMEKVKKETNIPIQEIAFLELISPSIHETMEKVIATGARDILVVPVLLFAAAHYKRDIPVELAVIQERHPEVLFHLTRPLDLHTKMIELVIKRIGEKRINQDGILLLVGRGSSDPEPILKLREIGQYIHQQLNVPVYTSFLTAGQPEFKSELKKLQEENNKIYVVPYLLFTGMLLKRMEREVATSHKEVILCNPLRYDSLMKEVLLERMAEKLLVGLT